MSHSSPIFCVAKHRGEEVRQNNVLVSETLAEVGRHIRPGVTTKRLDEIAEDFIRSHGAVPALSLIHI